MNFYLFNNFRVPEFDPGDPVAKRTVELAERLSCQHPALGDWAAAFDRSIETLEADEQAALGGGIGRCRVHACTGWMRLT